MQLLQNLLAYADKIKNEYRSSMYKKNKKYLVESKPFKWKQFKGDIILWLVRWYGRYALTYNDLKEMAAERGLSVERSTICRWVQEYGPELARRVKPHLKKTNESWKLDETYLKIRRGSKSPCFR